MRRLVAATVLLVAGCTANAGNGDNAARTGENAPVWTVKLPDTAGEIRRAQATKDLVIVVTEGGVLAYERGSGKLRWEKPKALSYVDDYAITDEAIVGAGNVYDLATGALRFAIRGEATVTRDALLMPSCDGRTCTLIARDLRVGEQMWRLPLPTGNFAMPQPARQAPSTRLFEPMRPAERGLLLSGTSRDQFGKKPSGMRTIDAKTGTLLTSWQIGYDEAEVIWRGGGFYTGDLVVHGGSPGATTPPPTVFDLKAGRILWRQTQGWKGDAFWGDAVLHDPLILVHDHDFPRAIDLRSGKVAWTGEKSSRIVGVHGQRMLVRTQPKDRADSSKPPEWHLSSVGFDGTTSWSVAWPSWNKPEVALAGNRIAITTRIFDREYKEEQGELAVLNFDNGRRVWTARGDGALIGIGPDWIVTGHATSEKRGPGEVSLYRL